MKFKNIVTILLLFTFFSVSAQSKLKVGDRAPEFSPFRWLTPSPPAFKNGKIYVVEFGATWCTPCAKAIPELNDLSIKHPDVTVISTFVMELNDHKNDADPAYVGRVKRYVEKKKSLMTYPIAVDNPERLLETSWLRAAGLNGIPAIFVVGPDGRIAAIEDEVSDIISVIERLKNHSIAQQPVVNMNRTSFDPNKLLLIGNNGGKERDFAFRSLLTSYDGTIQAPPVHYVHSYRFGQLDSIFNHLKDRVQVIGVSIAELHYLAYADTLTVDLYTRNPKLQYPDTVTMPHRKSRYGKQWHLPVVEVKDMSTFNVDKRSSTNRFNYSLSVPSGTGSAAFLQQCMRSDLNNYFGFRVVVEKRKMPVWNLEVIDLEKVRESLLSKQAGEMELTDQNPRFDFVNGELRDIIWMLGIKYGFPPHDYGKMPEQQQAAFIDNTGLSPARINFMFNLDWSFQEFTTYLASLGLAVKKSERVMNVVVITDP